MCRPVYSYYHHTNEKTRKHFMRTQFEGETIFFAYVTPPPSLLVSQELNTPFSFRNEKVETVVVDDAPPILLKFIHLAMRIIINRKLLKEKI